MMLAGKGRPAFSPSLFSSFGENMEKKKKL